MHKLIIVVWQPPSEREFEAEWSENFIPLAEQMPGLVRIVVSRPYGGLGDSERPYLTHEFFFEDRQALRSAMRSPAGQAAGRALMGFAGDHAQILFAEHHEEQRENGQTA